MNAPTRPGYEAVTLAQPTTLAERLKRELVGKVRDWENSRPRSRQKGVGASDLGHPCPTYLYHRAAGTEAVGAPGDPWPAIVGTSCHEHVLTKAFEKDERWALSQGALEIGPGIRGSFDLLRVGIEDVPVEVRPPVIVIDHKVLGADAMNRLKRHGAKEQYRTQVHAYGFGVHRTGIDVTHVAIAAWPRSGFLRDVYVWVEAFDLDVVERAFQRWYTLAEAVPAMTAEMVDALPKVDGPCSWCPFFSSTVHAQRGPLAACPGTKVGVAS